MSYQAKAEKIAIYKQKVYLIKVAQNEKMHKSKFVGKCLQIFLGTQILKIGQKMTEIKAISE